MISPHLHHRNGDAWFQPLTLMAYVPEKASTAESEVAKAAILHENVHFLQATTTFFGIYRFLVMWESLTFYAQQRSRLASKWFEAADLEKLRSEHQYCLNKLSVFKPVPLMDVPGDGFELIEGTASEGPIGVELTDGEVHGAYSKRLPTGDLRLFFFDVDILQESMPMALERWFGCSKKTYELARNTSDAFGFKYAAGSETVRALTGWRESDAVWWVTYALCDYALHTLTPNHVFFRGAQLIGETWSTPPALDALEDVYGLLTHTFEFEEVKTARANIFRHVSERLATLADAEDKIDRSIESLLRIMDLAIAAREAHPAYFASMQLRDPGNRKFVETFHMPTISSADGISFTSADTTRSEAVLYLVSAFHRLLCLVDEGHQKPCPFIALDVCEFDRTAACHAEPWNRMNEADKKVCIYRFVDHGFESAP